MKGFYILFRVYSLIIIGIRTCFGAYSLIKDFGTLWELPSTTPSRPGTEPEALLYQSQTFLIPTPKLPYPEGPSTQHVRTLVSSLI